MCVGGGVNGCVCVCVCVCVRRVWVVVFVWGGCMGVSVCVGVRRVWVVVCGCGVGGCEGCGGVGVN